MVRPYSLDLRERVVARVAAGETCRKVAATFGVSVASVVKWSQRYRATGSPAAKRMGNTRPLLLLAQRDWVLARIAEKSDITLQELVDALRAAGKRGSYGALWRFLQAEGFKKSLQASEQARPDVARRRERWKRHQHKIDPARLVFIDETWAKTNMTRSQSHRAGLLKAENPAAQSRRTQCRRHLETHRQSARSLPAKRMRELPEECRLRFELEGFWSRVRKFFSCLSFS